MGDVMDILALTNSAINFILYCTMSRQFRSTFGEVFRPKVVVQWISLSQYAGTTTENIGGEKSHYSTVV
ncbi:unnamed protein product [Brassicogethes aeneus]|uniref:G-protein coupled receptors family 1 profile domain-containing protein n=1 Tax=Brassicogethes aeneus TaxID=1431903 RepID=A0A9P0B6L3_BRAAE|nr:unnamed protein product [Brassicogethes aeneus]